MINPRIRLAKIKADGFAQGDAAWLIEQLEEAWRIRFEITSNGSSATTCQVWRDNALIFSGADWLAANSVTGRSVVKRVEQLADLYDVAGQMRTPHSTWADLASELRSTLRPS